MSRTLADPAYTPSELQLAAFAKALSHPVRIRILRVLKKQDCCYTGNLTEDIPLAQSTISQHLKALKVAGLIDGEINPPKVRYCINVRNWKKAKSLFGHFLDDRDE